MTQKRIVHDGVEEDVFSGWRRMYCWTQRAGNCAYVKRRYRRRERRTAKNLIRRDPDGA